MVQLTLLTVGGLREDYFAQASAEYEKRLGAYARVETVSLREEPIPDEDNPAAVAAALRAEGERILARIPRGAYTVALCVEGEMPDSPALARQLDTALARTGKLCLIIGSSHGLDPAVKRRADYRLSLSRLTFPHRLARVVLLEAVYRAFTILHGKRYHK